VLLAPVKLALRILRLAILAAAVYVVVSGVQVVEASHLPSAADAVDPASAIVVLGAPLVGREPGPDLTARLGQALALYRAHRAPQILLTDADSPPGAPSAADAGRAWLLGEGVSPSALRALRTGGAASGLAQAAQLLGAHARVVLVTDAIDALFAKGLAAGAGLDPEVSPATGSERSLLAESGPLWRQATAVAAGRIIGYGRVSWAAP
jgi:uncharacterized SAM-binding protein YcdF (DUF218 family)